MSSTELHTHIHKSVGECKGHYDAFCKEASGSLYPALLEMESRFQKQQGARTDLHELPAPTWDEYLRCVGVAPGTFRSWKSRMNSTLKQLQATTDPAAKPRARSKPSSNPSLPDDDDAVDILAQAGVRLAKAVVNPLKTDSERSRLANELIEAAEVGDVEALTTLDDEKSIKAGSKAVAPVAKGINSGVDPIKDLERALDEGSLVVTTPAPTSKASLLEGEVVSDRVRGAYATLRSVLNRMADTAEIERTLQGTIEEFILSMLDQHPYMQVDTPSRPELQITVTLYRAGRARISAGDWVEYRVGDDRLTKQIGAEVALGRVVEADPFSRPRVTWFNGTKWVKPYALFNEEAVRVLFAGQAAVLYPDAFNSYSEPTLSKAPAESLSEDNLPAQSEGPVTLGFLPHGEATWTQLVPGKKYQVRPAPSGGYGIYEPRSTVILQWYVGEDDARDAIDHVTAIAVGA